MIKIKWSQDEAVALLDLYLRLGGLPSSNELEVQKLSDTLNKRADILGIFHDDKFRNIAGLNMQLACYHFIVTNGSEGLSSASKLFYDTYKLYCNDRECFKHILGEFYRKYGK